MSASTNFSSKLTSTAFVLTVTMPNLYLSPLLAAPEDIAAYLAAWTNHAIPGTGLNEATLLHYLHGPNWMVWLGTPAEDVPLPIGYAITCLDNDICDLTYLAVMPFMQRKGYGREMLRQLCAKYENAKCVQLEVARTNEAALKLYLSEGFSIVASRESSLILQRPS